jgi:FkbM family methyltransferase
MITIDEHTFDEDKLTGGWVIDAGCRGFKLFDYALKDTECNVFALDIEDFTAHGADSALVLCNAKIANAALSSTSGEIEAYFFGNGTGNFLKGINGIPENSAERPCETKTVKCVTLEDIYAEIGTDIDLLKLDIEGAEYEVLLHMKPIPKQITVEFHEHCHRELHDKYIDDVIDHLCRYYNMTMFVREWPRYKYMDVLFTRKDL